MHHRKDAQTNLGLQFSAPLITSLVSAATGSSAPTFTRATVATFTDFEGRIVPVISGEARFQGARRVRNLVATSSEAFDGGAYARNTLTAVAGQSDPFGGTGAVKLTSSSADGYFYQNNVWLAGQTARMSIWLKADAPVTMNIGIGSTYTSCSITTSWQRFTTGTLSISGNTRLIIGGVNTWGNGVAVYCYGVMCEDVTGQSNQNPSEYVSVGVLSAPYHGAGVDGVRYFSYLNGNTVSSNVVTEAQGAAIRAGVSGVAATAPVDASGPYGYLAEGARTNLALYSQNFTNAAWGEIGFATTRSATAVTAPDGTLTGNSVLDNSTNNGNYGFNQAITVVASTTYAASIFVKKKDYRYIQFNVVTGGTNRYGYFDLDNSGAAVGSPSGIVSQSAEVWPNGWIRLILIITSGVGQTAGVFNVIHTDTSATSAHTGVVGTGNYYWGAQLEAGSFPSTYIPTTSSAVTRNADVLTYPSAGNISGTVGAAYYESSFQNVTSGTFPTVASTSGGKLLYNSGGWLAAYDGTGTRFNAASQGMSINTVYKLGTSWGSGMNGMINGAVPASSSNPQTFDGDFSFTDIAVGHDGTSYMYGTIRNVRVYNRQLSAAVLASLTA